MRLRALRLFAVAFHCACGGEKGGALSFPLGESYRLLVLPPPACPGTTGNIFLGGPSSLEDFVSQFNVVLVSASIHAGQQYAGFVTAAYESIHPREPRAQGTRMDEKLAALRSKMRGPDGTCGTPTAVKKLLAHSPALFEVIFWRRATCNLKAS